MALDKLRELLQTKKNFVFIGEAGSGKTEVALSLAVHMTKLTDKSVHLFDMDINIPQPEAYVLHKIVINPQREKKAEKDRAAILNLLPFLDRDKFKTVFACLTKKEQTTVKKYFAEHPELDLLS